MINDLNNIWMCLWCTEFSESRVTFDRFRYSWVPKTFEKMLLDEAWPARLVCRGMETVILHKLAPTCEIEFGHIPCVGFKLFGLDPAAFDRGAMV